MDFSSFDLQDDNEDLFKQNFQLNSSNHQMQDNSDIFNFIGENSTHIHTNNTLQLHPHSSFSLPQLSPDAQEGSFTNSSVLSGHNPEFNMSPLQIATHNTPQISSNNMAPSYHTPMQRSMQNNSLEDFQDDEEFFTPLVSPAMAPNYNDDHAFHSLNNSNHENIFSPLSSPALNPSPSIGDQSTLQQKLAFIERQQQQLRNMHNQLRPAVSKASPILKSTNGYTSPLVNFSYDNNNNNNINNNNAAKINTKKALQQKIAMSSPQFNSSPRSFAIPKSTKPIESPLALRPQTPHTSFVNKSPAKSNNTNSTIATATNNNSNNNKNGFIAPATPSLLMKLGSGSTNNNNVASSPSSVPSIPSSSSSTSSAVVDNMPVLPAAMLEDTTSRPKPESSKRRRISQQSCTAAFSSPRLSPNDNSNLVSPAGLRPQQSPRALKPLISPSLHPNGKRLSTIEEETARALLTSKSNYENLKEGKAKSLGIDFSTTIQSGIENRRSAHKAAEQKRRDTLKQSFDSLRIEIVEALVEEEAQEDTNLEDLRSAKEKDVKQMSKVVLLQHSYEYILRLKNDNKRKDEKQHQMREELMALRKQLGLPQVTEQEREQEEKERQEEKDRKEARLQRLKTAAAVDEGGSS